MIFVFVVLVAIDYITGTRATIAKRHLRQRGRQGRPVAPGSTTGITLVALLIGIALYLITELGLSFTILLHDMLFTPMVVTLYIFTEAGLTSASSVAI